MSEFTEKVNVYANSTAKADDFMAFQNNVIVGQKEEVKINEGKAYSISRNVNAFNLQPIDNNVFMDTFVSENPLFKRFDINKIRYHLEYNVSGIEKIELLIQNNNSVNTGRVTISLVDSLTDEIIQENYVDVERNMLLSKYQFDFGLQHLRKGIYYLDIKSNITGIFIGVTEDIENTNEKMTYINDNVDPEDYNIAMKIVKCNEIALEIENGEAVINGSLVQNNDSHVNIELGSTEGDRIDIIAMNSYGELILHRGDESDEPIEPFIPDDELKICKYYLETNQVNINEIIFENITIVSIPQRIEMMEADNLRDRLLNYSKRISARFNAQSDTSLFSTISCSDGQIQFETNQQKAITIYTNQIQAQTNTSNVIIEKNGRILLEHNATKDFSFDSNTLQSGARDWRSITTEVPYDTKKKKYNIKNTRYVAGYIIPSENITLNSIQLRIRDVQNAKNLRLFLFKVDTDERYMRYIKFVDREIKNDFKDAKNIVFSGFNVDLVQNERYAVVLAPTSKRKKAALTSGMYGQANDQADTARVRNTFLEYYGLYGPKSVNNSYTKAQKKAGYNNLGLRIFKRYTGTKLYYVIKGKKKVYQKVGWFYGTFNDQEFYEKTIKSLKYSLNITCPANTSYTIEFSNNGGVSWVQGNNGVVTFQGTGNKLRYRIKLVSNNQTSTPVINNNAVNGVQPFLSVSANIDTPSYGSTISSGYFKTPVINGLKIAKSKVGFENAFGNFEWFRLWMNNNGSDIFIDIEGTNNSNVTPGSDATYANCQNPSGTRNQWNYSLINITLDDFYKGSIDFIDETIPETEYNLRCGANEFGAQNELTLIDTTINDWQKHSSFNFAGSGTFGLTPDNNILEGEIVAWKNIEEFELNNFNSIYFETAIPETKDEWQGIQPWTYQLILSKSENCETEDFVYNLKGFDRYSPNNSQFIKCFMLLKKIKSIVNIKSIGIKYNEKTNVLPNNPNESVDANSKTPTIYIKNMKLLESNVVPFYMPYTRLKITVDKKNPRNPNPDFSYLGTEIILT